MSEQPTPTTKKLKSMLRMLTEHGVARYKDAEVEIEFSNGFMPVTFDDEPKEFDISDYDQPSSSKLEPVREMTEDEYLWWSADNTS